ncbi:MAG: ABC transporter ATP-binding protein [Clostridiales bacterium]|nr:ABC transporter ATP-binding protein [Clostridiales bacterium]
MPLISIKNASMGYEGKTVLSDLSLDIYEKDYVCIVGENGSGKTTLMKCLLGLIQPLSGKIEYGSGLKQNEIGYLPQKTVLQKDFPASVSEVVLSGCLNNRHTLFYSREQKNIAAKNMELTGIYPLRKKCFRELSGGQQQRALLSRALCATSKLLILDEPVTGLDPKATSDMYSLIKDLNRKGITIIMVSHDVTASVNNASKILHLSRSNYFYGSAHQYLHSDIGKKFMITSCPCDDCQHNRSSVKGAAK